MTEQAKVPAIRFAGFTDPWEQRKLGSDGLFQEDSLMMSHSDYWRRFCHRSAEINMIYRQNLVRYGYGS